MELTEKLKIWEDNNKEALEIGTIIHLITFGSVEEAYKLYPHRIDFILDFMNREFYKKLNK